MKLKNLNGKTVDCNVTKYTVDWDRVVSLPQFTVKKAIMPFWIGGCVCEEFVIPNSILRIDLINFSNKTIVEISPKSSHGYNKFFHKSRSGFLRSFKRDIKKAQWADLNEFRYIEITDEDLKSTDLITKKILL